MVLDGSILLWESVSWVEGLGVTGATGRAAIAASVIVFSIVSAFVFNLGRVLLQFLQPRSPDLPQFLYLMLMGFAGGLLVMVGLGKAFGGKSRHAGGILEPVPALTEEESASAT